MNSTIKIDIQESLGAMQPVIKVTLDPKSNDVRDTLVKSFFEKLAGESNWLFVCFNSSTLITIYPVTPDQLEETAKAIQSRLSHVG